VNTSKRCTQISGQSYPNSTQGTAWDSAQVPQAVRSQPAKQLHRLPLHCFGLPFATGLGFSGSASEGAAASSSYRGAMLNGSSGCWWCSTQHRGCDKHSSRCQVVSRCDVFCCSLELGSWMGSCPNTQMSIHLPYFAASANCATAVAPFTLHRTCLNTFSCCTEH